jgi:hypothetical protein
MFLMMQGVKTGSEMGFMPEKKAIIREIANPSGMKERIRSHTSADLCSHPCGRMNPAIYIPRNPEYP